MGRLSNAIVMLSALMMAGSVEKSSTYMKNADSEDMVAEATGYDYETHSGVPFSYKTFKTDMAGKFSNLDYPPIPYGKYKYHYLPLQKIPLGANFVPGHYDTLVNSYGIPISYAAYVEPIKGYDAFMESLTKGTTGNYGIGSGNFRKTNKGAGGSGAGSGNFGKSGGLSYGDVEKASHGEKGARGYITYQEFDKALKGSKDNEQNKGFYKAAGGNNGGYYEVAGFFDKNRQSGKGNKGESFSDKKDSNKGSKTTGYHKVYLKDDYTKDHSFYDKADKNGYFRRYGDFKAEQDAEEGGFKKGGHHDSGFYGDLTGAKGYSDKGKVIDEAKGYKGASGDQRYYQNDEEFAKKGGNVYGKQQGFREGEKYVGR